MDHLLELREIVSRHAVASSQRQSTAVARLGLFRADRASLPTPTVYCPMFCIVIAGRKRVLLGNQMREYGPGDAFLVTLDLPVVGTILSADAGEPYLAISLELHRPTLASVAFGAEISTCTRDAEAGFRVARATPMVLDTARRLAQLLDHAQDIAVLAPLIETELLYRLMTGVWGPALREIIRSDSRISQVTRAAVWLRRNYSSEYRADLLAEVAGMSVSSLNRHFRAVTAMSPLEYQKQIRLQEARRLLLTRETDVAGVGYAVGYGSAAQFNREYRRLFGDSPGQDAKRLRRDLPE